MLLLGIATHIGEGQDTNGDASGIVGCRNWHVRGFGGTRRLGAPVSEDHAQGAHHVLTLWALWILVPVIQIRRMERSYIDGQARAFEAHGNQDAAVSTF